MNMKIIVGILIAFVVGMMIVAALVPTTKVAKELQDNQAAKEIDATYHIPVTYEELGTDGNGYTVQGQTQWNSYSNGTIVLYKVVLDDDIDPNSYEANAILYHEMGHIVMNGGTEAQADDYAASKGYHIVDAYHGVH